MHIYKFTYIHTCINTMFVGHDDANAMLMSPMTMYSSSSEARHMINMDTTAANATTFSLTGTGAGVNNGDDSDISSDKSEKQQEEKEKLKKKKSKWYKTVDKNINRLGKG